AELDRNDDGRLTQDEWRHSAASFRRADHDGNGVITLREFIGDPAGDTARNDQTTGDFDRLDRNGDGRVSRDEWPYAAAAFDASDRNRDGVLTAAELHGDRSGSSDLFDVVDDNRDGRISRAEWRASPGGFDRLDRNDDGYLSRSEASGSAVERVERSASAPYKYGYDRGLLDGRQAGREDAARNTW